MSAARRKVRSLGSLTLDELRRKVRRGPTPAGVAIAAASASLALELISMVLSKTLLRAPEAVRGQLKMLAARAGEGAKTMMKLADEDTLAYQGYMRARRIAGKDATKAQVALQRAIDVPIGVARTAADAVGLCAEAAAIVHGSIAADLLGSALLLEAATKAATRSAIENTTALRDPTTARAFVREAQRLEQKARRCLRQMLAHART